MKQFKFSTILNGFLVAILVTLHRSFAAQYIPVIAVIAEVCSFWKQQQEFADVVSDSE